jgi:hypothetical protein
MRWTQPNPFAEQKLEMRKKSKLVILLIAGIVGLVGLLVVLILNSTSEEPIKLTLKSYTNGCAVITITNQSPISYRYMGCSVESDAFDYDTTRQTGMPSPAFQVLGSGQQDTLSSKRLHPWRI